MKKKRKKEKKYILRQTYFKNNILKFLTTLIKTFLNKKYFLVFTKNDVLVV